jgi:hypothetical protein
VSLDFPLWWEIQGLRAVHLSMAGVDGQIANRETRAYRRGEIVWNSKIKYATKRDVEMGRRTQTQQLLLLHCTVPPYATAEIIVC